MIADLCEIVGNICDGEKILEPIMDLVGPRPISFREVLEIGATVQQRPLKYIEIPRPVIEPSVKYFVAPMLPGILTYEQFQLLFQDNIANVAVTQQLLGRMPTSTIPFWERELEKS
jgi:hypothetical protein